MDIIFAGATPINKLKVHMPVSFVFTFTCPIAQRYRQRRARKVSLLATIWKYGNSARDSACPQDRLVTVKKAKERLRFVFSVV